MSNAVGPGRPPTGTRFRKGQSGNPKGRPKAGKEKSASAFDIVIDRTLTVTQGGVPREVSVEEALQHRTYQDAVAGNRSARRDVLKMIAKREEYLAARHGPTKRQYEFRTEPVDPDNADAAMLILGIAARDRSKQGPGYEGDLLLEPWAVQAALRRRRGGQRLADKEIAAIKRCTRDADRLRWPRRTDE